MEIFTYLWDKESIWMKLPLSKRGAMMLINEIAGMP